MSTMAALLKRETELVARFKSTLLREQEVLRSGNTDGLTELSKEKLSLVDSLNQTGAERSRILSSPSEATIDMQAWLSAHPKETEAAVLWDGLLAAARDARDMNDLNGSLINALHQKTSEALFVLTQGQVDQSLYSSSGQSALNTGSRIIDSA